MKIILLTNQPATTPIPSETLGQNSHKGQAWHKEVEDGSHVENSKFVHRHVENLADDWPQEKFKSTRFCGQTVAQTRMGSPAASSVSWWSEVKATFP